MVHFVDPVRLELIGILKAQRLFSFHLAKTTSHYPIARISTFLSLFFCVKMDIGSKPYKPLDTAKKEIRLLTIQPGPWSDNADWDDEETSSDELELGGDQIDSDVVRCTLSTVSLDDNPEYEPLSYVWGDSSERAGIIVDGVCMM